MSSSHVGDHYLQYAKQVGMTDNQTRSKLYQLLAEA